jgi:hypothetical protein
LEKLLAVNPLMSETDSGKLASSARYQDYLVRAAIFILFIVLWFLIGRLTRHRKHSHET